MYKTRKIYLLWQKLKIITNRKQIKTEIKKSKINCNLRFRSLLVVLIFDYKVKGLSKHFVHVLYSTEFKRKLFVYLKHCCRIVVSGSTRPRSWIGDSG